MQVLLVNAGKNLLGFHVRGIDGQVFALNDLAKIDQGAPDPLQQAVVLMKALGRTRGFQALKSLVRDLVLNDERIAATLDLETGLDAVQAIQQITGTFDLPLGQVMKNDFPYFFDVAGLHRQSHEPN